MLLRIPFSLMNPAATSINIFTIVRAFIFFDPRDDLCQIRVQFLSSIANLKGYWIHYIFFGFIALNNLSLFCSNNSIDFSFLRILIGVENFTIPGNDTLIKRTHPLTLSQLGWVGLILADSYHRRKLR